MLCITTTGGANAMQQRRHPATPLPADGKQRQRQNRCTVTPVFFLSSFLPFLLQVDQLPLPEVGPGQVLIRVRAAAINPSDVLYLQGAYSASDSEFGFPYQGGFEGSGTVVGHGGGLFGQSLLHQRVAFALQDASAYAEYAVVDQDRVLALPADLSYERGAFSFVNPLTAVGMVSTALSEGHTGIVQTAAASALGKMFLRLCRQQSIPLINVVRREEQKQLLIKHGALPEHVLVSTDKDFEEQLRKLTHDMHVTAAFDAVAGDSPGQVFTHPIICLLRGLGWV